MPRVSPQQYAFNGGEFSPLLHGRQDLDKYRIALDTCLNAIPLVQGAWTRRPGSAFMKTTKFGGTRECRLKKFQFSTDQAYALEFGHQYIRLFTESGVLTHAGQTIEAITKADPGVVTITGHGYSDGDRLHLSDIGGMTQLEGREVIVSSAATDTFELHDIYGNDIDTSGFDAFTSGGEAAEIFEVATTYTEAEVKEMQVVQSGDVVYLFQKDHAPAKLVRSAALTWTLSDLDLLDGPYFNINVTATTLTLSGTSGSVTVTASAVTGINGGSGFLATDVGRLIRWQDPAGNWTWLEITAHTDTTNVTATIQGDAASAGTATANWRLGLYSDTTGFPRTGTFHDSRLYLAGSADAPQRFAGSRVSDFENFEPTAADGEVTDSQAVGFSLSSGQVDIIQWMTGQERGLLVGTAGGEWVVRASQNDEVITPTNVGARQASVYGSSNLLPVRVSDAVLFMQQGDRKLREMAYVFEADGFRSPDLTVLAEHITLTGLVEMELQKQPQTLVWAPRVDGVLAGLSYARDQNVIAWHRHILGGDGDVDGNAAEVESATSIPALDETTGDVVFMSVKRYINGQTERYIEVLTKIWERGDEQEDAFHFDSGITFVSVGGTNTLTGLSHLEGETLGVWADGTVHPDVTVSNGSATLDTEYNVITVGYKYNSDGVTLPVEAGAADGSAQTKKKRIHRLGLILLDTLGLSIGPDEDSLTEILFRQWGQAWGTATPMFTGAVRERFEADYDRLGQVMFRANTGAPATVLALALQLETQDDS